MMWYYLCVQFQGQRVKLSYRRLILKFKSPIIKRIVRVSTRICSLTFISRNSVNFTVTNPTNFVYSNVT